MKMTDIIDQCYGKCWCEQFLSHLGINILIFWPLLYQANVQYHLVMLPSSSSFSKLVVSMERVPPRSTIASSSVLYRRHTEAKVITQH